MKKRKRGGRLKRGKEKQKRGSKKGRNQRKEREEKRGRKGRNWILLRIVVENRDSPLFPNLFW